jgi:zinc protease
MIRGALSTVALLAGITLSAPSWAAPPLSLPIEEHRLPNGMRVLLAPDPTLDDATVLVRYEVGTADEPAHKDGLAHLVEHLMYSGSRHAPGGYFRFIERAGGWNLNGTTSLDDTRYFVTVPPEQIPLVLWLESDRMGFLSEGVSEAVLQRELALVSEEARERIDDGTLGTLGETAFGEVFPPWHPYHRAFGAGAMGKLSMADVQAFTRTWYAPRNATLIVTGHFDAAAVLALATKYFGDLPGSDPPVRLSVPPSNEPDVRVEMRAGVIRDFVTVLWPTPAFNEPGDAELDVAATILADPNGRLQRALVDSGLAVHVWALQRSLRRGSAFLVSAAVADGPSADHVARVLERVVNDLAREVKPEEAGRARVEWADTMLLRLQTSAGRAQRLALLAKRDPWGLETYGRIQPTDVERTLRVMLTQRRSVVVVHQDRHYRPSGTVVDRQTEAR